MRRAAIAVHDYVDEREETAGPFLAIPLLSSLDYSLGRSHQTRPSLIVSNQPAFGVDGIATGAGILAVLVCGGMPPAMADTIRIEAKGLTFEPAEVSAHVGDTIEWTNSDFVAHTATAPNRDWILCRHTVCGE